jgi:hypothetical protein
MTANPQGAEATQHRSVGFEKGEFAAVHELSEKVLGQCGRRIE